MFNFTTRMRPVKMYFGGHGATGLQILVRKGVILVPRGYLQGWERAGWASQAVALPQLRFKIGFISKPRSPGLINDSKKKKKKRQSHPKGSLAVAWVRASCHLPKFRARHSLALTSRIAWDLPSGHPKTIFSPPCLVSVCVCSHNGEKPNGGTRRHREGKSDFIAR